MTNSGYDLEYLSNYVIHLSDQLVDVLNTGRADRKTRLQIDALRSLGADESKSTKTVKNNNYTTAMNIIEADKKAKVMAKRVLSAYDSRKVKKDGTPLYVSYLDSLYDLINENPEVARLPQVMDVILLMDK
jgi:hypothetical protein